MSPGTGLIVPVMIVAFHHRIDPRPMDYRQPSEAVLLDTVSLNKQGYFNLRTPFAPFADAGRWVIPNASMGVSGLIFIAGHPRTG